MANAVLVPLDGSSFAEAALPQAVAMAARMKATLHLARVQQYEAVRVGAMLQAHSEDEEALRFYLATVEERVRRIFDGPVLQHVLQGPIVEALEECIAKEGIALLVLSTHGRRGLARVRLGSVADALLHRMSIPILAVRPSADAEDSVEITPVAPGCRQVLVALDGSALAASILATAEALAALWRVPITLVTVVTTPMQNYLPGVEYLGPISVDPVVLDMAKARAEERLQPLLDGLRARGTEAEMRVELAATPADGLCAVAERMPGAVLAIATHGYSGFRRLTRGSVADQLLHRTPVPLLVWRPGPVDVDTAMDREAAMSRR